MRTTAEKTVHDDRVLSPVSDIRATNAYVVTQGLVSPVRHYIVLASDGTGYAAHLIDSSVSLILGIARVFGTSQVGKNLSSGIRRLYEDNDVDDTKYIVASNLSADSMPMVEELTQSLSAELVTLDDDIDHHRALGAALYSTSRPTSSKAIPAARRVMPSRYAAAWAAAVIVVAVMGIAVALMGSTSRQEPPTEPSSTPTVDDCVSYRVGSVALPALQSDPDVSSVSESPSVSVSESPSHPAPQASC
ncbi:hypothetical protein [Rhodococcus sp. 1168]|uniref:hypothetical protein n=1 Tax=Rhodococcus sp. 1168 TaxID=2018041 RepID=UPI000A0A115A|nr:hypothetical protein [Rhodococcus sp. 1168]ORI12905.1 hypothetical protein BJI47_01250 [Rhodococcus sp. 1168]